MASDRGEDFYRSLFEHSIDAVLYTVPDGQILAANPAACSLFKYTEAEICALGRGGLVDPESPQLAQMLEMRERTGRAQGELIYRRSDGAHIIGWTNSAIFLDEAGRRRTVIIVHDLTEVKEKETSLRHTISELDDLYSHAPCGYHSVDANSHIIKINQTELSWLGYSREDVIGQSFRHFLTPASQQVHREQFERFKQTGSVKDLELELVRKDGHTLPVLLNSTAIYDENGHFVMSRSTIVDLTDRKALELELKRQAQTDFLTGLNNRASFNKLAMLEFATSKRLHIPLGFLILDVDDFKKVNDVYGHDAGDTVLKGVGECCLSTLREIDILGRWGGEEFVALLPGIMGTQVREVAERLREALSEVRVDIGQDKILSVTVSIGGSWLHSTDASIKSMIKRADMALYAAKAAGRNCVMLDSEESA